MYFQSTAVMSGCRPCCACRCDELSSLPASFGNLTALTSLNLRSCESLVRLPESFGNLTALTTLRLQYCSALTSLPESFGNLTALTSLNLRSCESLVRLPESFGNLTALTTLRLQYCSALTSLPESFGNLTALTELELQGCTDLRCLPESFGNLTALTELWLRGCSELRCLPGSFGNLTALTNLTVSECPELRSLPESIGNLSALTQLSLAGCTALCILPDSIGNLAALEELYLTGCSALRKLPDSLSKLVKLTAVGVRGCTSLPGSHPSTAPMTQSNSGPENFGVNVLGAPDLAARRLLVEELFRRLGVPEPVGEHHMPVQPLEPVGEDRLPDSLAGLEPRSEHDKEILVRRLEPSIEDRLYASSWYGIKLLVPASSISKAQDVLVTVAPGMEDIGAVVRGANNKPFMIWSPVLSGQAVQVEGKGLQLQFSTCPCSECQANRAMNPDAIFRRPHDGGSRWIQVGGSEHDPHSKEVKVWIKGFSDYVLAKSMCGRRGINAHQISEIYASTPDTVPIVKHVVNAYTHNDAGFWVIAVPTLQKTAATHNSLRGTTVAPKVNVGASGAAVQFEGVGHDRKEDHNGVYHAQQGEHASDQRRALPLRQPEARQNSFASSLRRRPSLPLYIADPVRMTAGGREVLSVFVTTRNAEGHDVWWHGEVDPMWGVMVCPDDGIPSQFSRPAGIPCDFPDRLTTLKYQPGSATRDAVHAAEIMRIERAAREALARQTAAVGARTAPASNQSIR
eukprot:TRINITY_DN2010_c0_g1_i8.p1 TRINITY_DN2010_c0_g1~~TRINITY_DN2010_c0_g1_i8.p1  ORF type:complete len:742 (-),score=96.68 TRINITY_DN2010_c0_g1_i8:88-2313(-)